MTASSRRPNSIRSSPPRSRLGSDRPQRQQVSLLHAVAFTIEDLPGWYLGSAGPGIVTLDANAAGNSWFIDATPNDDSEFAGAGTQRFATSTGGANGRIDALSTVLHELGHQLGLDDTYASADSANLMYGWIHQSERRLPAAHQADGADPSFLAGESGPDFLFGVMNLGTLPANRSLTIVYDATVDTIPAGLAPLIGGVPAVSSQVQIAWTGPSAGSVNSNDPDTGAANDATATPLDTLSLGNRVWNDTNRDSLFNGAEVGINGVVLNLYVDTNLSNDYTPGTDTFVATTTTAGAGAAAGTYTFANLMTGDYIVQVAPSNFTGGGALVATPFSSPGVANPAAPDPDDDVDNDDNGQLLAGQGAVSLAISLAYNAGPFADGTGQFDLFPVLDFGFVGLTTDLEVTKAESSDPVYAGADTGNGAGIKNFSYVITAKNNGPDDASSVLVTETLVLPAGVTFDSYVATQGTYDNNTGIWTVGGLTNGQDETLTIFLNVSAATAHNATIMDTAAIAGAEPDTTSGNNSDTENTTVLRTADTPSVTNAATDEDTQTTSGLVISRNASDGAEVTHFKITNIQGGTLFQNNGTTPINNGDFITFAKETRA